MLAGVSLVYLITSLSLAPATKPARGGVFREGIVGRPTSLSPLFAMQGDAERDFASLVYAGLFRATASGSFERDLAESYDVYEQGRVYDVTLKPNLFWHDAKPLTASDVVFTIRRITDPATNSPFYTNFQEVAAEVFDERTVRFTLKEPYALFIQNLTIGLIPEHVWTTVPLQDTATSELNLRGVGAGPFRLNRVTRAHNNNIVGLELEAFDQYHRGRPLLDRVDLLFFTSQDELVRSLKTDRLQGAALTDAVHIEELIKNKKFNAHSPVLGRYYAIFFNPAKQSALREKTVRQALNLLTDRNALVGETTRGLGSATASPFREGWLGFEPSLAVIATTSPDVTAQKLLKSAGFKKNESGMYQKKETSLSVTLTAPDIKELADVARIVAGQWQSNGIEAQVKLQPPVEFVETIIRPRDYEAVLFGQVMSPDPDPFSFWHSSQIYDPGLNLALYASRKVDDLLERARQTINPSQRAIYLRDFHQILMDEVPAIFLYNPPYTYFTSPRIKGIDLVRLAMPQDRLSGIENWYVRMRR